MVPIRVFSSVLKVIYPNAYCPVDYIDVPSFTGNVCSIIFMIHYMFLILVSGFMLSRAYDVLVWGCLNLRGALLPSPTSKKIGARSLQACACSGYDVS